MYVNTFCYCYSIKNKLSKLKCLLYCFLDKPSTHGKLKCISIGNGVPQISGSEGFIAEALTREAIVVHRSDSHYRMIFIAPTKIYSSIHKKSVSLSLFCYVYAFNLIYYSFFLKFLLIFYCTKNHNKYLC